MWCRGFNFRFVILEDIET